MPRPTGSPNRVTSRIRASVASMLDNTAPEIAKWLKEVYEQDGANEALKRVYDFLEYAAPKMSRVEHTGEDGEKLLPPVINIIAK